MTLFPNSTDRRLAVVEWHSWARRYHAEIADHEGEGPRGEGITKLLALYDLHSLCSDPSDLAAITREALRLDPVAGEQAVGAA